MKKSALLLLPILFLYTCIFSGRWLIIEFGRISFEQFIFMTMTSTASLLESDPQLIRSGVHGCIVNPAIATAIHMLIFSQKFRGFLRSVGTRSRAFKILGDKLESMNRKSARISFHVFIAILAVFSVTRALGVPKYVQMLFSNDNYFGKTFQDPKGLTFTKNDPKNLILIYVESFETAYAETSLVGKNLLADLEPYKEKYLSFNYLQQNSAEFTIGAQVATQCGVPLNMLGKFLDGNEIGVSAELFLPRATCLGEILRDLGYRNHLVQGSSLEFAGTGKLMSQHGYQKATGGHELKALGYDTSGGWGATDDVVLTFAKRELQELRSEPGPYNLTIALLDTHHPNGILSKSCAAAGGVNLDSIITCTAKLLADFIAELEQSGILKDTRVVILGDHLSMPNSLHAKITPWPHRQIFNLWVGENLPQATEPDLLQYDVLPSVLDFIGISASSSHVALGYSGFAKPPHGGTRERLEQMNEHLGSWSPEYMQLWLPKK